MYLVAMFLNFTEVFEPCMPSHSLVNVGHKLFYTKSKAFKAMQTRTVVLLLLHTHESCAINLYTF